MSMLRIQDNRLFESLHHNRICFRHPASPLKFRSAISFTTAIIPIIMETNGAAFRQSTLWLGFKSNWQLYNLPEMNLEKYVEQGLGYSLSKYA